MPVAESKEARVRGGGAREDPSACERLQLVIAHWSVALRLSPIGRNRGSKRQGKMWENSKMPPPPPITAVKRQISEAWEARVDSSTGRRVCLPSPIGRCEADSGQPGPDTTPSTHGLRACIGNKHPSLGQGPIGRERKGSMAETGSSDCWGIRQRDKVPAGCCPPVRVPPPPPALASHDRCLRVG